jgi:hypothetical protein
VVAREIASGSTRGKTRKGSLKHDAFKPEQQKVGGQLLASGYMYEPQRLKELPPALLAKITVRKIRETGLLVNDKAVAVLQAQKAQEKNARRTTVPLTMQEWKTKASKLKVRNDTDLMDPTSTQRLNDLETLAQDRFGLSST